MPIKIVPKDNMGEEKIPAKKNMGMDSMMKKKNKKKKKSTESTGAFPFIAPGQMKMLHGMMGKSKSQTLNKGGKISKYYAGGGNVITGRD
jgi:hypothetical protein